jgi:uncharacterized protein YydD (DUF2326 family)
MRLISLTANAQSFHPVEFNRRGLSLILGKQKAREAGQKSTGKTYNGVGKSLLLYLINYCLGSDANESFVKELDSWEFTLRIELETGEIPITRRVAESDSIQFGPEKLTIKKFRDRLGGYLFPQAGGENFLTFRSLIGLFLRPGKSAYTVFDGIHFSEKPIQRLARSAYLLGLDIPLVQQKYDLIQDLRKVEDAIKRFQSDPILKEYFQGHKDVNLDIQSLRDDLGELDASLASFKVADNYHEVEQQLSEAKSRLQKQRNVALALEGKLRQVEESLKTKSGITLEAVQKAYKEAQVHFPQEMLRSLKEVQEFHSQLISAREVRLKKEQKSLLTRLRALATQLEVLNLEVDTLLKFLNDHGALGELLSLKDRANATRNRLERLTDYTRLTKQYKDQVVQIQADLANSTVVAQRYLDENDPLLNEISDTFRKFSRRIYPEKQSGLFIKNNDGENQTRFDIDVKILDDASDGINEAKIFAYDMTLASLQRNHTLRFLCHDSRLYSDIDPRQRAAIFQIAEATSREKGFQYIATINEDQAEAFRAILGEDEYKRVMLDNVVLELKDDSAEDKLLGIEVDLDYD